MVVHGEQLDRLGFDLASGTPSDSCSSGDRLGRGLLCAVWPVYDSTAGLVAALVWCAAAPAVAAAGNFGGFHRGRVAGGESYDRMDASDHGESAGRAQCHYGEIVARHELEN